MSDVEILLDSLDRKGIEVVGRELHDSAEVRAEEGAGTLHWSERVYDRTNMQRCDSLVLALRHNPNTFHSLFADFHNNVFLGAKKDVGAVYAPASVISDSLITSLTEDGIVPTTASTTHLYTARYYRPVHGKLLMHQISDRAAFSKAIGLNDEQRGALLSAPAGSIALHTLYDNWDDVHEKMRREGVQPKAQAGYTRYMQSLQTIGIANLVAILTYDKTPSDRTMLLRLMNAAYSLDNPNDPFSSYAFEDPIVQHETGFDWQVISRAIVLFGLQSRYERALTETTQPAVSE